MENMTERRKEYSIMCVEDSPEDVETIKRAFEKVGMINPFIHFDDGDEALDYLFRKGNYTNPEKSPRPNIILLDLNLPGTDGYEILSEVKNDDVLKKIPVIVLTTSSDERDIEKCFQAGANSYIIKPVSFDGFVDAIKKLKNYWFKISVIPDVD
jgi:two-component system response regulator